MNAQLLLITICYLASIFAGIIYLRPKKETVQYAPSNDYATLMSILNQTIQQELTYKTELDYKVKDVRVIYNFEDDLRQLVERIMYALSPSFLKELEYYHNREYIILYVTRYVQSYLIEFTKKNKPKTK